MPADHFARFYPATCAGLGLLMAGGVNLLLLRHKLVIRTVATLAAVGIAIVAAAASEIGLTGHTTNITVRILAVGLIPFLILGSRWFVSGVNGVVLAVHRPALRFSLLAFAGIATMVGSIVAYGQATGADNDDEDRTERELLHGKATVVPARYALATTDQGTRLVLGESVETTEEHNRALGGVEERILRKAHLDEDVIRRSAADDRSNCHGWVFTRGRFVLNAADVELILRENSYRPVTDPRAGDLVVYRHNRTICHTAVVRYVAEGQPVMVEGKWGDLGVFLHTVDRSVYGKEYTFHRSTRRGHQLTMMEPTR